MSTEEVPKGWVNENLKPFDFVGIDDRHYTVSVLPAVSGTITHNANGLIFTPNESASTKGVYVSAPEIGGVNCGKEIIDTRVTHINAGIGQVALPKLEHTEAERVSRFLSLMWHNQSLAFRRLNEEEYDAVRHILLKADTPKSTVPPPHGH